MSGLVSIEGSSEWLSLKLAHRSTQAVHFSGGMSESVVSTEILLNSATSYVRMELAHAHLLRSSAVSRLPLHGHVEAGSRR